MNLNGHLYASGLHVIGGTTLSTTTISPSSGIPLHINNAGGAYAAIELGGTSGTNCMAITQGGITNYGSTQGSGVALSWPTSATGCTISLPTKTGTVLLDSDLVPDYYNHLVVSSSAPSNILSSSNLPYWSLLMVETCSIASSNPTAGGSTLIKTFTESLGSNYQPVYISNGHLYQGTNYAGGTFLTVNGTSYFGQSKFIYTAENALSTTSSKRYLLGSYSTASMATTSTNANCYMSSGNIYATAFYASSDARLKDNIGDPELDYLEIIDKINLREFTWKNDEEKNYNIGIIAQELKEILPERYSKEFVGEPESADDYFTIGENKFIYLALGAIKDQQKEINELKERVSKLELK